MAETTRVGLDRIRSLELFLALLCGWKAAKYLGHWVLLATCVSRKLAWKCGVACISARAFSMGSGHPSWWFCVRKQLVSFVSALECKKDRAKGISWRGRTVGADAVVSVHEKRGSNISWFIVDLHGFKCNGILKFGNLKGTGRKTGSPRWENRK